MGIVKTTVYIRLVAKPFYSHNLMPIFGWVGWEKREMSGDRKRVKRRLWGIGMHYELEKMSNLPQGAQPSEWSDKTEPQPPNRSLVHP
jgi:hypothetical protein